MWKLAFKKIQQRRSSLTNDENQDQVKEEHTTQRRLTGGGNLLKFKNPESQTETTPKIPDLSKEAPKTVRVAASGDTSQADVSENRWLQLVRKLDNVRRKSVDSGRSPRHSLTPHSVSDEVSDDNDENGKPTSSTSISIKSSSTLGSSLRRRSVDIKPLSKIDEMGATDKKIPPLAMHPCHPALARLQITQRRNSLPIDLNSLKITSKKTLQHNVIIVGSSGVGKNSLCTQFKTAPHVDLYYSNPYRPENCEVTVKIDSQLTRLTFIVLPSMSWLGLVHGDTIVHEQVDSYNPTVFAVLFAVDEKTSMQKATKVLTYLEREGIIKEKIVILVATKCDLVKTERTISFNTGKDLAQRFGVKYIEISSVDGTNVDELLVGMVTQLVMRNGDQDGEGRDLKSKMKSMLVRNKTSTDLMKLCQ